MAGFSKIGELLKKKQGYSNAPDFRKKVETVMGEFKAGELHSGGSGKKVKGRKQAVAIALSEARRKRGME